MHWCSYTTLTDGAQYDYDYHLILDNAHLYVNVELLQSDQLQPPDPSRPGQLPDDAAEIVDNLRRLGEIYRPAMDIEGVKERQFLQATINTFEKLRNSIIRHDTVPYFLKNHRTLLPALNIWNRIDPGSYESFCVSILKEEYDGYYHFNYETAYAGEHITDEIRKGLPEIPAIREILFKTMWNRSLDVSLRITSFDSLCTNFEKEVNTFFANDFSRFIQENDCNEYFILNILYHIFYDYWYETEAKNLSRAKAVDYLNAHRIEEKTRVLYGLHHICEKPEFPEDPGEW